MHRASQGYIDIFLELHANSWPYVKTGSGTTLYFKVKAGVQQCHIPSPFPTFSNRLFNKKCNKSAKLWNHLVGKEID